MHCCSLNSSVLHRALCTCKKSCDSSDVRTGGRDGAAAVRGRGGEGVARIRRRDWVVGVSCIKHTCRRRRFIFFCVAFLFTLRSNNILKPNDIRLSCVAGLQFRLRLAPHGHPVSRVLRPVYSSTVHNVRSPLSNTSKYIVSHGSY